MLPFSSRSIRVQAVGYGGRVVGFFQFCEVCLDFGLCYAVGIHVAGRCGHKVFALSLVYVFGVECRIEDYFEDFTGRSRSGAFGQSSYAVFKEFAAEGRDEFVVRVVMVYAVGEPYLFDVCFKCFPLVRFAVAVIVCIHGFEQAAQVEIMLVFLIP